MVDFATQSDVNLFPNHMHKNHIDHRRSLISNLEMSQFFRAK